MNALADNRDRPSVPLRSMLVMSVIVPVLLIALAVTVSRTPAWALGHEGTPAASSCAAASPQAPSGTPERMTAPPTLGTPVTASCLTVTLRAESTRAGPGTLTVEVLDADGTPVVDAGVVINTRHIGMDHGTSTSDAVPSGPGTYVADNVSLGMGGEWEAQVVITRADAKAVVVTFVIDLVGPE